MKYRASVVVIVVGVVLIALAYAGADPFGWSLPQ